MDIIQNKRVTKTRNKAGDKAGDKARDKARDKAGERTTGVDQTGELGQKNTGFKQ